MEKNKHGEGSIYKLTNGKWGAAVSLGTDENGKRIRPTVTGKTKDEVMRKMHDKLVALGVVEEVTYSLSEDQIPSDITVEVFIKHWLLEQSYNVSSRSLRDYAYSLEKFRSMYGDLEMRAVTKQLLTSFFNYCKNERGTDGEFLYSQTALGKFFDRLKAVFTSASANGIITVNPFADKNLKKPTSLKPSKRVEAYSDKEIAEILELVKDDIEVSVIIRFMLLTGLRTEEVLGLRWCDIDMGNRTITIQHAQTVSYQFDADMKKVSSSIETRSRLKTDDSQRRLSYEEGDNAVFALLLYWRKAAPGVSATQFKPTDFVFGSTKEPYLSYNALRLRIQYIVKHNNYPHTIRLHRLRHTAATKAAEAGASMTELQMLLGHTQPSTTIRYLTQSEMIMQNATSKLTKRLGNIEQFGSAM